MYKNTYSLYFYLFTHEQTFGVQTKLLSYNNNNKKKKMSRRTLERKLN